MFYIVTIHGKNLYVCRYVFCIGLVYIETKRTRLIHTSQYIWQMSHSQTLDLILLSMKVRPSFIRKNLFFCKRLKNLILCENLEFKNRDCCTRRSKF